MVTDGSIGITTIVLSSGTHIHPPPPPPGLSPNVSHGDVKVMESLGGLHDDSNASGLMAGGLWRRRRRRRQWRLMAAGGAAGGGE